MTRTTTTIVVMKNTPTPRVPVPFISHPPSSMNDPPPHTHTHTHTHPVASRCLRVQTMVSLLSSKRQRTGRATRPRRHGRLKCLPSSRLRRRCCAGCGCGWGGCCRCCGCQCRQNSGLCTTINWVVQRDVAGRAKTASRSQFPLPQSVRHTTTRRSNPCTHPHPDTVTASVRDNATSATRLSHPALSTTRRLPLPPVMSLSLPLSLALSLPLPPTLCLPPTLSLRSNTHTGIPASRSPRTKPLACDVTRPASFMTSSCSWLSPAVITMTSRYCSALVWPPARNKLQRL